MDIEFAHALKLLDQLPTRVIFGPGRLDQLGECAGTHGARRVLLVTDSGIVGAGHAVRATQSLAAAGLATFVFDGAAENPTTEHVAAGLAAARDQDIDFLVSLGGGSAMDCAKGINLLLTNGGEIKDYWGINKAARPMLPMIAVPTTAGTGSEAQSFALISDAVTHRKMACGDRRRPQDGGLRPRVAILDPNLTLTAPHRVTAAAGIDAVAHAVETSATKVRTRFSQELSRTAWQLLTAEGTKAQWYEGTRVDRYGDREGAGVPEATEPSNPEATKGSPTLAEGGNGTSAFERVLKEPRDADARARMLLGAHLAGAAIEQSMLGAAHASANPLTARFGITHGVAVGMMLPHVVRHNCSSGDNPYAGLLADGEQLAQLLERFVRRARFLAQLSEAEVPETAFRDLADMAAQEWTGTFNPRPMAVEDFVALYRAAR